MMRTLVTVLTILAAPVAARAQSATTARPIRLLATVSYQITSRTFEGRSTFTAFLEEGSSSRGYDGGTGIGFEFGAIYNITSAFGLLASFERTTAEHDASFDVSAPHPLYFNQPRTVSDERAALGYEERALNIDAVYSLESGSFVFDLFGGGTLFETWTKLVDEVTTSSVYPFNDLSITNVSTVEVKDDAFGFNVGAALTYRFTPVVGISLQGRFSRATLNLQRDAGEPIEIDAGGFRLGAGIRLAF